MDEDGIPDPKRLRQGFFQVSAGRNQPFTIAEVDEIRAQALRATVSARIPFHARENRELKKLFGLLWTAAPDIMPSRKVIAGRLLNEATEMVEVDVKHGLQGRQIGLCSDGWKARKKMDVKALCANSEYKTYTLELVDAPALSKDGPMLCKQFGEMIDRVQKKYRCYVIFFGTDADGGSKQGHTDLGIERPWLFVPSCWAHQVCRLNNI
ncbi:hypothetical protein B0H17DRAFT_1151269 [Mycena rosella]|uniref:DUF659 domain-containing protein n=1 Tax=Mycena rosella TaxID=1033263 RepID=A0AAD7BLZ4_MYCRO|nr:hypothetical protein B0H17DRAFT_1151269 [Mycena rosella]